MFIYHKVLPPPNLEAVSQLHTLTSRNDSTSHLPQETAASAADTVAADASLLGLEAKSPGGLGRRQKDPDVNLASCRVSLLQNDAGDTSAMLCITLACADSLSDGLPLSNNILRNTL